MKLTLSNSSFYDVVWLLLMNFSFFEVNKNFTAAFSAVLPKNFQHHHTFTENKNKQSTRLKSLNYVDGNKKYKQCSRRTINSNFYSPLFASSSSSSSSTSSDSLSPPHLSPAATATTTSTTSGTSLFQDIGKYLLTIALQSPIWKYWMVPAARQKIVNTAEENNIPWNLCYNWLLLQSTAPWALYQQQQQQQQKSKEIKKDGVPLSKSLFPANSLNEIDREILFFHDYFSPVQIPIPDWYKYASYHAYETGHLSWKAAIESELASASIGARNIPQAGRYGELVFRSRFTTALETEAGATIIPSKTGNDDAIIVDIGCATGISTRLLAERYPEYDGKIIGIDLSPYNIAVARTLQQLAPTEIGKNENGTWVSTVSIDDRIEYRWENAVNTSFANNTVDIVNFQFVAHELPVHITCQIIQEAARMLKPSTGQLWFCEMDFQAPAYIAQRNNALLFSLIRSTEPYLDEYADGFGEIQKCLLQNFDFVSIAPATGRHFAIVATKNKGWQPIDKNDNDDSEIYNNDRNISNREGIWNDLRFDDNGNYRIEDTHLQVWENKKK